MGSLNKTASDTPDHLTIIVILDLLKINILHKLEMRVVATIPPQHSRTSLAYVYGHNPRKYPPKSRGDTRPQAYDTGPQACDTGPVDLEN